jgi:hypothetical protein
VHWPGTITLQIEAEEFVMWQNKLASAGVMVEPAATA